MLFPYYFYLIAVVLMILGVVLINQPQRFEKYIPDFFSSKRVVIYLVGIGFLIFCLFLLIPQYSIFGLRALGVWLLLCLVLFVRYLLQKNKS